MEYSVLDEGVIAELREVMGDQFGVLCERYAVDAKQRLTAMAIAIVEQDADALRGQAHSLKGASANLGAMVLAQLCLTMEQLAEAASWNEARSHLQQLEQTCEQVTDRLLTLAG